MFPIGHVSISFLISQIGRKAKGFGWKDIIFIIFCGNIFDFDFLLPPMFSYPNGGHHYFPTHTPLAGIILFLILFFLFRKLFSKQTFVLAGLAMLSHLVLDDLSYWLYLLGLAKEGSPQIFWLYPFDPRRKIEIEKFFDAYSEEPVTNEYFLKRYLTGAPYLFVSEFLLMIIALLIFTRKIFKLKKR